VVLGVPSCIISQVYPVFTATAFCVDDETILPNI
jgi:hypothetical protein